jgi:hypothetical protein
VDVGAMFVAVAQSFEAVQPGEAAFDDPSLLAQAKAVGDTPAAVRGG